MVPAVTEPERSTGGRFVGTIHRRPPDASNANRPQDEGSGSHMLKNESRDAESAVGGGLVQALDIVVLVLLVEIVVF